MAGSEYELTKKGHVKSSYTEKQLKELSLCEDSPVYFIENFIKVQHPIKGSVPLILYDYQKEMIAAYHEQRFCVSLTARQMGKSFLYTTKINKNSNTVEFKSIMEQHLTIREKIISWFEKMLFNLAK